MKELNLKSLQLIILLLVPAIFFAQTEKTSLQKANELLSQMTIEEKIGQMSQVDLSVIKNKLSDIEKYKVGSVLSGGDSKPGDNTVEAWADMYDSVQSYALKTRLKIPVIYGVDAVHGHNGVKGAVIFPHNVGLGCTKNPALIEKIAAATASDVAATGIDWNFSPCLAVARDDRWGRAYESYSENPILVSQLAAAYVRGLQGKSLKDNNTVAATIKHFAGDGATSGGKDRGNAIVDEKEFMEKHIQVYKEAIDAGAATVMASFSLWNGKECHGNRYLLDTILRQQLGFQGVIVSDWGAIDLLPGDYYSDIVNGINSGLDLIMVPIQYEKFLNELTLAIKNGDVDTSRINDAVRRILTLKFDLGLFENPLSDRSLISKVGCQEFRDLGRQAVRESAVLLKNNNSILPISKSIKKIHVAGSHGDNLGFQCGGWSLSWQGLSGDITKGTTVYEALKNALPGSEVTSSMNGEAAQFGADIAVVVIGEEPYAEWFGDNQELMLAQRDIDVIMNIKRLNIPIVCVLMTGRPMIIDPILHYCDAVIEAWLPGTEGEGIADILLGDYVPTGTLSFTWPRDVSQIPINIGDASYDPLFPYGYGLTSFKNNTEILPSIQTALLIEDANIVEIAFNQSLKSAPDTSSIYVTLDGLNKLFPDTVRISTSDKSKLQLIFKNKIINASSLTASFNGKNLETTSGKKVLAFSNYTIYCSQFQKKKVNMAPGMIQVENYFNQKNVSVQDANDQLGAEKVILETGEWIELMVDVEQASLYDMYFRFWSENKGFLELSIDDEAFQPISVPKGSDYDWKLEAYKDIELTSGKHVIKLFATGGTIHVNWIAFDTFRKVEKSKK